MFSWAPLEQSPGCWWVLVVAVQQKLPTGTSSAPAGKSECFLFSFFLFFYFLIHKAEIKYLSYEFQFELLSCADLVDIKVSH